MRRYFSHINRSYRRPRGQSYTSHSYRQRYTRGIKGHHPCITAITLPGFIGRPRLHRRLSPAGAGRPQTVTPLGVGEPSNPNAVQTVANKIAGDMGLIKGQGGFAAGTVLWDWS